MGGGGRFPAGLARPKLRRRGDGGAACAGLEAGGGDVVLPVAQLELEVAEAALEDGIGAVVEGREGRGMAASAKTDAVRGPQLQGQLLVRCSVVPGHRKIFSNFVNLNNKFTHCLFIDFTSILVWQHQWCAIQSLCWGDVGVLSWCGPETQEDPGEPRAAQRPRWWWCHGRGRCPSGGGVASPPSRWPVGGMRLLAGA